VGIIYLVFKLCSLVVARTSLAGTLQRFTALMTGTAPPQQEL